MNALHYCWEQSTAFACFGSLPRVQMQGTRTVFWAMILSSATMMKLHIRMKRMNIWILTSKSVINTLMNNWLIMTDKYWTTLNWHCFVIVVWLKDVRVQRFQYQNLQYVIKLGLNDQASEELVVTDVNWTNLTISLTELMKSINHSAVNKSKWK